MYLQLWTSRSYRSREARRHFTVDSNLDVADLDPFFQVRTLQMSKDLIVSGSYDKSVLVSYVPASRTLHFVDPPFRFCRSGIGKLTRSFENSPTDTLVRSSVFYPSSRNLTSLGLTFLLQKESSASLSIRRRRARLDIFSFVALELTHHFSLLDRLGRTGWPAGDL